MLHSPAAAQRMRGWAGDPAHRIPLPQTRCCCCCCCWPRQAQRQRLQRRGLERQAQQPVQAAQPVADIGQTAGQGKVFAEGQQVPVLARQRAQAAILPLAASAATPTCRCRSCSSRHQASWLCFLNPSSATSMPCPAASRCCTSGARGWQGIGGGGAAKSVASSGGSPLVGAKRSSPSPGRRGSSGDSGDRRGGLQQWGGVPRGVGRGWRQAVAAGDSADLCGAAGGAAPLEPGSRLQPQHRVLPWPAEHLEVDSICLPGLDFSASAAPQLVVLPKSWCFMLGYSIEVERPHRHPLMT